MYERRRGRGPRGPRRPRGPSEYRGHRELRPRPLGDKCNPLCPFFRCTKNALRIKTEYFRGRPMKVAYCEWIGDKCIGASCKFAACERNAMLPDGRCSFAIRRRAPQKDFEEELLEMEKDEAKFKFKDFY
ncbi:MAG: hypothetical protein F7C35_05240 [Desulfurococcales archaeon]|nr:hypothetical protein [Desulfurococcales archaeon]